LSYETMWNGGFLRSGVMAPSIAFCSSQQRTRGISLEKSKWEEMWRKRKTRFNTK